MTDDEFQQTAARLNLLESQRKALVDQITAEFTKLTEMIDPETSAKNIDLVMTLIDHHSKWRQEVIESEKVMQATKEWAISRTPTGLMKNGSEE